MLWVGVANGQEIILVNNYAALLHDTERAERSGLLDVPNHLVIDTLKHEN